LNSADYKTIRQKIIRTRTKTPSQIAQFRQHADFAWNCPRQLIVLQTTATQTLDNKRQINTPYSSRSKVIWPTSVGMEPVSWFE
jgi:hypothetical protein